MKTLARLVSRKWWIATLLVIVGMAVLVQLGFWQLDRLQQRRDQNALVAGRWQMPTYDLENEGLPADLEELGYRRVELSGDFDYARQIVRTNMPGPNGEAGVTVVTPLVLANGKAVLVARGWVPQDLAAPDQWPTVEEPAGAPVIGLIKTSETIEGAPAPAEPLQEWYRIDIPLIQLQMPYDLYPVFLQQLPEPGRLLDTWPSRSVDIALDEGSHLSYSIQWFMFALILGFGYTQFVRLQDARDKRIAAEGLDFQLQGSATDADPGQLPLPSQPALHQKS